MEQETGIYLVINFDWPTPFEERHGKNARVLHDALQDKDWIREVAAGSGGVGGRQSSIWVFWLKDFSALGHLLSDMDNEAAKAYRAFFSEMINVEDFVRGEVYFW